jgi:hypothetical protein
MMPSDFFFDFAGRTAATIVGVICGAMAAWLLGRWKRHRERGHILTGNAHDTVVVEHHLVERTLDSKGSEKPAALRIRSLGQAQINHVIPNGYLATELVNRALHVSPRHTLISMAGAEGSYLLETLMNFVCDRVHSWGFDRDQYVMAPCCEPAGLAHHQPITILLISRDDLALFETWPACRDVKVEHGSDGARVLTLMELAKQFKSEQEEIAALRDAGKETKHHETSYILDLALDKRTTSIPVKAVAWKRFEEVLKQLSLESQSTSAEIG